MFFTLFGYWLGAGGWGCSQGIGTQPAYAVFHSGQLKNRSFENLFFDILTPQYDHPSYSKHVLGRIYMFFTLFGYWVRGGGGGGSQGMGTQPADAAFHSGQLKNRSFKTFFLILRPPKRTIHAV